MEIGLNNNISFKAGLTPALKKEIHNAKCSVIENSLKDNFNISANFKGNKTLAKLMSDSIDICKEISEKYNLPFFIVPPKIRVYNYQELTNPYNPHFGFCTGEKFNVIEKEPEYPARSIFIKNIKDSADSFNDDVDCWYRMHITSADSIFAPFIHEFMHNVHLAKIFDKFGFEKGLAQAKKMAKDDSLAYFDKYIIRDQIGNYASRSEVELLPEVSAKIITESLDENNKIVKNPMKNLENLPEFVQSFVKKQLGIL